MNSFLAKRSMQTSSSFSSSSTSANCNMIKCAIFFSISFFFLLVLRSMFEMPNHDSFRANAYHIGSRTSQKLINAVTWNVAAINNNPFEYWITADSMPQYSQLMQKVATFIDSPEKEDIPIHQLFSDVMFEELLQEFQRVGIPDTEAVRSLWKSHFRDRKIISEFIKDPLLGKKRLISMPDRITNTIHSGDKLLMRPTVINCYQGQLSTVSSWWQAWKDFFFQTTIHTKPKKQSSTTTTPSILPIYKLIPRIDRGKYPAITIEEEKLSIPLSLLSLALFDVILVHMMNQIDSKNWQLIRQQICQQCNFLKADRTLEILTTSYAHADIIFLQEVAGNFFRRLSKSHLIFQSYQVIESQLMDIDRDQNSFLLLKNDHFDEIQEVTSEILQILDRWAKEAKKKNPIVPGDFIAITAIDKRDRTKYLLASFHGDTNGLATIPIVNATHYYATNYQPLAKLLFGLDANTYHLPEKDQQGVEAFANFYRSKHLNSCYGLTPNPTNFTTFHARTHLQPQLNKAVTYEQRHAKGDRNPKDFILFFASDYEVLETRKDNTGERKYIENMVFPTLQFPSDHGITSTVLLERPRV